ncbi:MAG: hypothetical protein ABI039_02205 [Vicinamibacterales bacterium]
MSGRVLSLCLVLAGIALVPLGLRAVNARLPGAEIRSSYLPTFEAPRPRQPFDDGTASALRQAQPEFIVIGDSMAGVRVNPGHLSRRLGKPVAGLFEAGSPVAFWYLEFKNFVVENDLTHVRGALFFFRDDQLTTQVVTSPLLLDRAAKDDEPALDRIFVGYRLGRSAEAHRLARAAYEYDRTRIWLEPRISRFPLRMIGEPASVLDTINRESFALDKLRRFAASDLPVSDAAMLDFDAQVGRSLLPTMVQLGREHGIHLGFIRVQRRPTDTGPPAQSEALTAYLQRLQQYLAANGAYYHDDRGDPAQPLSIYADGDHLKPEERVPYTDRFADLHARFFQ